MDISRFDDLFDQLNRDISSFDSMSGSDVNLDKGISYQETVQTLRRAGSTQPQRTANYIFRTSNRDRNTGQVTVNEIKGLKAREKGNEVFNWLNRDVQDFMRLPSFDINRRLTFGQLFNEFDEFGALDPFQITSNIFNKLERDMNSFITGGEMQQNTEKIGWEKQAQQAQAQQLQSTQSQSQPIQQ